MRSNPLKEIDDALDHIDSLPDKNSKFQKFQWPAIGEISSGPDEIPYPESAHPEVSRRAINELHGYLKAPLSMIGTAVLAQMALPAQGLADVARDDVMHSPCSINVAIVAGSGERKSGIDGHCSRGARGWEKSEKEVRLPANRKGMAIRKTFDERKQSITKRIGALEAKGGAEAEAERKELEERLQELVEQEADVYIPLVPVLYHEDATPEGLSYSVATGWPSAMLASDEAGIVIGGRGMSQESALSFITLLNRLWDGREYIQTRKQAKAAEIKGRRFSVSLMMQPELMTKLVEQGARHLGFLARCLVAAPATTMGTRLYTPPPDDMEGLTRFNGRASELLSLDLPVNDRWELEPPTMQLDAEAHRLWAGYHDSIEQELGEYGEYALVKDVGAKSAENAARIACVFQIWENGPGGSISAKWMASGIALAHWHLNEALRLFFQADKPQEIQDAEILSNWIATEARQFLDEDGLLSLSVILQRGPYRVRDKARRDAALKVLADPEISHIRLLSIGRRKLLQVNPSLLRRKSSND